MLDTFRPFSWLHAASLAGVLIVTFAAVAMRRQRDLEAPPSRWEKGWVAFTVLLWISRASSTSSARGRSGWWPSSSEKAID